MQDLNLEDFYVTKLSWSLGTPTQVLDVTSFDKSLESQNDAFQTIKEMMACESTNLKDMEKDKGMIIDPKRIEVGLRRIETTPISVYGKSAIADAKNVVVVGYFISTKDKKPVIECRTLFNISKIISKNSQIFESKDWWICKIETHFSSNTSCIRHFNKCTQSEAWRKVEKFIKDMTKEEIEALHSWAPFSKDYYDKDWDTGYENSTYYQNLPSTYNPPVAEYRVWGDDVGVKIHLEQIELLAKHDQRLLSKSASQTETKDDEKSPTSTVVNEIDNFKQPFNSSLQTAVDDRQCNELKEEENEDIYTFFGPNYRLIN